MQIKQFYYCFVFLTQKRRWGDKNLYDLIDKEKCGVTKMSDLTEQQIRKYKIDRARLFKGSKSSMYVREDILIPIIMQSRLSDPKTIKFRSDLGFNQINLILKKEQSVVIPLLTVFSAEKIKLQHKALKNKILRTGMYFSEHKFAVEIDEKGHANKNQNEENKRQTKTEKHSGWKLFHRINPDAEGFDIFLEISKIQNYITQSNKEKLEKEKNVKIKKLKNKLKKTRSSNKRIKNGKNKKLNN